MSKNNPHLDDFGQEYLRLTLEIHKHIDGYIDAYYGPEELRIEVNSSPPKSPVELLDSVHNLQDHVPTSDPQRADYLKTSLRAIECTVRTLNGEVFDYLEEVNLIYDIQPPLIEETTFQSAHQALDLIVPPATGEDLAGRLNAWRKQFEITGNGVLPLLEIARDETRRRTLTLTDLPKDENVEVRLTNNQPWGAYNWYKGYGHSLIEFNTDIPFQIPNLINTFAHEGYPGHHTEHVLKEELLYRQKGYAEQAATLLHSPSAVISEGIATTALEIIFPDQSHDDWNQSMMFPAAGLPTDSDLFQRIRQIDEAIRPLRHVVGNAAILYHTGKLNSENTIEYIKTYGLVQHERAEKSFSFISHPLFRSYIFTYTTGYDLITQSPDPRATFFNLLTHHSLPSHMAGNA